MIKEEEKQALTDIIQLLPDSVANQIAAGEVIQRPASVVKELVENAVDAGSTEIKLIIKDAGKTLVQVIDNGCGMSETDARLCFERHATSKIKKADDLFAIKSLGFRGEAMASIAAISQTELKSKRIGDELGTKIEMEASQVSSQEPCSAPSGTSIAVKNLFYNVPARRKFLKSNKVETRHIIDEFQRVAIPNAGIAFSMQHNNNELFHLESGSLRKRLVGIFGKNYNEKLVPVEEETTVVKISGFIGKPEYAKKTRGEQFFFVNRRFMKNPYLHHAVQGAFEELIANGSHASYFINLEIEPGSIDINIHPTKTEIKFEDEKAIYAIIRSAVRQSLGKYHIAPSLDFERETMFDIPYKKQKEIPKEPTIHVNPDFNPFEAEANPQSRGGKLAGKTKKDIIQGFSPTAHSNKGHWEKLFTKENPAPKEHAQQVEQYLKGQGSPDHFFIEADDEAASPKTPFQLQDKYILSPIKSGLVVIHRQRAYERILYERYLAGADKSSNASQQQLFPQTVELTPSDFELVKELQEDIKSLGFDIREFGKNAFVIHGLPSESEGSSPKEVLESVIEHYKKYLSELKLNKRECLARSMAQQLAARQNKLLETEEMSALINELFACEIPYTSPSGKMTLTTITLEELNNRFQ